MNPSAHQTAVALATAAAAAGYAPSVHNTQPWRWRIVAGRLELFADRSRQLGATDAPGQLLLISCGAALHHARVALAAEGWTAETERLPDSAQPDLLARLRPTGRMPVTPEAIRLVQTMQVRHTDRRPVSDEALPADALRAIEKAVSADARIQIMSPDQVLELAAAASRAATVEASAPAIREELEYWTGRTRPAGTGLPAEVLPEREQQTTVPGRTFGQPGTLPIGPGHDQAAVYAGTVALVQCNVVPASHGCDRDGSPSTPGCGWYVDLRHAGDVYTRYCHMLTRPAVVEGQTVVAGQIIGVVGSSGHSSGRTCTSRYTSVGGARGWLIR